MGRLPEGLVRRRRKDGSTHKHIYFKKQHRNRRIRGSSGTDDPEEAARRLRKIISDIDGQELYGIRPKYTFSAGARKLIEEFQGSPKTLRIYAQQADVLSPYIGDANLPVWKDDLSKFINDRRKEVSTRTINLALEVVRMVNRKACYYWKDEDSGMSWIESCPIIQFERGPRAKPYPLSWEEQDRFFDHLPAKERKVALFAVNTGLRDGVLCRLEWSWEEYSPIIRETVFRIPGEVLGVKNRKDFVLVLNRVARGVVESQRGNGGLVFPGFSQVTTKTWYRAWKSAGLPMGSEWRKGVHNLRHTFGKRLRDAGVDERDVRDLLHHVPANVTRHYSEPEIKKLKECVEKIVPKLGIVAPKLGIA